MLIKNFICAITKLHCEVFRPFWSAIRWKDAMRIKQVATERVTSLVDVRSLAKEVYSHYQYKLDDITELYDSLTPPSEVYQHYVDAKKNGTYFKDDCDGFHTCIYHILNSNNIPCYLLTFVVKPFKNSHTVLLFKIEGYWRIIDYTNVYDKGLPTPNDAIEYYWKRNSDGNGWKWEEQYVVNLLEYEYGENGMFKNIKIDDVQMEE